MLFITYSISWESAKREAWTPFYGAQENRIKYNNC